jgi:hypothetical protein
VVVVGIKAPPWYTCVRGENIIQQVGADFKEKLYKIIKKY